MTVHWTGPRTYAHAGLCVPCGGCNAAVGDECDPRFHGDRTSQDRLDMAHALGFITVVEPGELFEVRRVGQSINPFLGFLP